MPLDPITHGGGFYGYGGTSMAVAMVLGQLDHRWVFDTKPAAAALIAQRLPGVENLGDMTAVWPVDPDDPANLLDPTREVERVLVESDSWPCQPHSQAGRRKGTDDHRALWPNVGAKLAATRPAIWFGENVARCVTSGELRRVVRTLADLGYVGAWGCQRLDHIGGSHQRNRVWVLAVDPVHPDLDLIVEAVRAQPWWTDGLAAGDLHGAVPVQVAQPLSPMLPTPTARDGVKGHTMPPHRVGTARPDGRIRAATDGTLCDAIRAMPAAQLPTTLPTPAATDGKGAGMPAWRVGTVRPDGRVRRATDGDLASAVAGLVPAAGPTLPTPSAADSERGSADPKRAGRSASGGSTLNEAVAMMPGGTLPTPTVADARNTRNATANRSEGRTHHHSGWTLSDVAHVLGRQPGRVAAGGLDLARVLDALLARLDGGNVPARAGAPTLLPTPRASDGPKGGPNMRGSSGDWSLPGAVQPERFGVYAAAVARHAALLGRDAPDPTLPGRRGAPQLSPWFVEWMMCLPHGHVCGLDDLGQTRATSWRPRALSLLGDGVVPAQGAAAYRRLIVRVLADRLGVARPGHAA